MICRMCKSDRLELFLDLGCSPPSDNFVTEEQFKYEKSYPVQVFMCQNCGLAQLGYIVLPEEMYNKNYPYETSIAATTRSHFFEMAKSITEKFSIPKNSLVVDIGSNVGVLLQGFKNQGMQVIGIEPSPNIAKKALANNIETINGFFNIDTVNKITSKQKARVVTATNVFAHINDLDEFMKCLDVLLDDNGIFVVEAPYFVNLLDNLEYDTIYHEHLSYLSVKPLVNFFQRFGYELFDAQETKIHGGSIRVFVARKNRQKIADSVEKFLNYEREKGIHQKDILHQFSERVKEHKEHLRALLLDLKKKGKRIVGISAPAKGMALLNYASIDSSILDYATEKSTLKIGKYTPGTHIPVKPDDTLLKDMPDYGLLLAWNLAEEIMNNLVEYKQRGGKFIIPIPEPRIV